MEPQAKRMKLFTIDEQLQAAASDSELDSDLDLDEGKEFGYQGFSVKEALARLRSALLQLPSRTARRCCILAQEWLKDLLIPSDFGQKDMSSLGSGAVLELFENGLLQLLPKLLQAQHEQIVLGALEVVGAVALYSTDTNLKLTCCKPVIETLSGLLECRRPSVMLATCHCLIDIMVAAEGCRAFVKSAALASLMRVLCWITDRHFPQKFSSQQRISGTVVYVHVESHEREVGAGSIVAHDVFLDEGNDGLLLPGELEELFVAVLQATSRLLPYSLTAVPSDLLTSTLSKMQLMWQRMKPQCCKQMGQRASDSVVLAEGAPTHRHLVLASLVMWLAMEADFLSGYRCSSRLTHDNLQEVFPSGFFQRHWELAPSLIKGGNVMRKQVYISCLMEALCKNDCEDCLHTLLSGLTACPPIPADEVDHRNIFKDLQQRLGEPIRYGQDVRLVKSGKVNEIEGSKNVEHHYCAVEKPGDHSFSSKYVHIEDCLKAFKLGYTIALRGMEFRFPCIAAIADSLATALGQASVGANLYLTPANAQGLAAHYDDHCVLVCQVYGHKHWSIYSPQHELPRLYDNRCPIQQNVPPVAQILVDQGDWLYIPRGFGHQAYTCSQCTARAEPAGSEVKENQGFSLHLTFGVEVEPPFEWEGLIHMALHDFGQRRMCATANDSPSRFDEYLSRRRVHLIIFLLHIAVRVVGKECPAFRKACSISATVPEASSLLVPVQGSQPRSKCGDCMLKDSKLQLTPETPLTPESFFLRLLSVFSDHASFENAQEVMRSSLPEKNGDGLSWMAWLRHLPTSGEDLYSAAACSPLLELFPESLQPSCPDETTLSLLGSQFASMKEEFVQKALYPEACAAFELVLGKYRDSRKKLINGFLALHAKSG